VVADDEGLDGLLERAKLQMAGRTFFTCENLKKKKKKMN